MAGTKPWWRVDADVDESDKIVGLPSDAARWAWVRMGCKAKTQRTMGVFVDRALLRFLLGTYARHLVALEAKNLVHEWPTGCSDCIEDYADVAEKGVMVVHNYLRKQRDNSLRDPTNAARQARHRAKVKGANNGVTSTVTSNGSLARAVAVPVTNGESESTSQVARTPIDDVWSVVQEVEGLVGMFGWSRGSPIFDRLEADVGAVGVDRLVAEYRALRAEFAGRPMDAAQLIYGAHKRLFPIPGAARSAPKGFQPDRDEVRRAFEN